MKKRERERGWKREKKIWGYIFRETQSTGPAKCNYLYVYILYKIRYMYIGILEIYDLAPERNQSWSSAPIRLLIIPVYFFLERIEDTLSRMTCFVWFNCKRRESNGLPELKKRQQYYIFLFYESSTDWERSKREKEWKEFRNKIKNPKRNHKTFFFFFFPRL
jgi:hypothetical protein